MSGAKRKARALLTASAGVAALLVAGAVLHRPLEEHYWLWKLREGDQDDKERAADRLGEMKVEEAVPILLSSIPRELPPKKRAHRFLVKDVWNGLSDQPYWVRALVKRERAAVPYLREVLKEESVFARSYAAYMLGKIGPPAIEAVPDIVEAARRAIDADLSPDYSPGVKSG